MRRSPTRAPRPTPAAANAAYDRAEAIVRTRGPGLPDVVRHGLGAVAGRVARRRPERPREPAHGGADMGGLMAAGLGRRTPLAALAAVPCSRRWRSCPSASCRLPDGPRRGPGVLRHADRDRVVRRRHRLHAAGHVRQRAGARRAAADHRGRDRARGRRRGRAGRHRRADARPTTSKTSVDHLLPNTPVRGHVAHHAASALRRRSPGPRPAWSTPTTRFTWKTKTGDRRPGALVRGLGRLRGAGARRSARTASRSRRPCSASPRSEPVDFFIYADQDSFYDALGPSTRENVGGQADAEIRTLFALIPPSQIDDAWVGDRHPARAHAPRLRHGGPQPVPLPAALAQRGARRLRERGLSRRLPLRRRGCGRPAHLIPLSGLVGQFPTSEERFRLAYGESVSAVDFFVRTYGQDALVKLISSYADGRTDDEAFSAAIGVDVAGFEAAWLADLKAETPVRQGPRPAPAGPLPAGWAPAPSPDPNASAFPVASHPPTSPDASSSGDASGAVALAVVVVLVVGGAGLALYARRRRPTGTAE